MLRSRLAIGVLVAVIIASLIHLTTLPGRIAAQKKAENAAVMKSKDANTTAEGEKDPAFPLESGKPPIPLSKLKGKIVLVDFWATWCGPCRMSIPELIEIHNKYKDQGVIVIGISTDDAKDRKLVFDMKQKMGIPYTIAMDSEVPNADVFQVEALPSLYIFGRDGKLAEGMGGYDPGKAEQIVKELLKKG